jgi:GTPase
LHDNEIKPERAIAVAVARKGGDRDLIFEQLSELESLAETAGAEIIEKIYQELAKPNPKTYIGIGKVEELKQMIVDDNIQLVIFDDDLSPAQIKNLQNAFQIKVIDRSWLILDIFAKHARSLEAKTQVELAQVQYLLPRLTRLWTHLSKQYGGSIGNRGPGETQIETDRRILKEKIISLKQKLREITIQRQEQGKGRTDFPRFALVGYTNAGKSTLMNALTDAGVYVENKLFATLDTTVRAFSLPSGQKALISDTVGFIRKLPAHLIASFRSTLAEAIEADILIHVVDVSHPYFRDQIKVVNNTLETLKIQEKPTIIAFNKIDLLHEKEEIGILSQEYNNTIYISAARGINVNALLNLMQSKNDEQNKPFSIFLPYSKMELLSKLYDLADIIEKKEGEEGIGFKVKVHPDKHDIFTNVLKGFINSK